MAQEQDITFITEDIPGANSFVQSGRSLRLSYAARKEAKYINDILLNNIANPGEFVDPTSFDEKYWGTLRASWKQEANVRYPDEGDYRVWIIDPQTGNAVPLGEMVEFMGGDIRETPGGQPCTEYTLDLSGVVVDDPLTFVVEISYEDCFLKPQQIVGIIEGLDGLTICVGRGLPYTNLGGFVAGVVCDLNFGNPECSEYTWDLTGLPPGDLVTLEYRACGSGIDEELEDTPRNLGNIVSFCAQNGSPTAVSGVISYVGVCSL
jgi:hypothetical protein